MKRNDRVYDYATQLLWYEKYSLLTETLSLTKCFQQADRTAPVCSIDKGGKELEVGYWNDVVQQGSTWSSAPTPKPGRGRGRGVVKVYMMHSCEVSRPT